MQDSGKTSLNGRYREDQKSCGYKWLIELRGLNKLIEQKEKVTAYPLCLLAKNYF